MTTIRNYTFGRCELRPGERALRIDGKAAAVGARAFDLLLALIERRDRLVTKAELLELVWPQLVVEEGNLATQVSSLRKLIGPEVIATIPGRGYRFAARLEPDGPPVPAAAQTPAHAAAPLRRRPGRSAPVLLGRQDDLDALRALVQGERVVTIVGAGGIGKTRIAHALSEALKDSFADGTCMVELAPVMDPSLLESAVAQALGITPSRAGARADVIEAIRERSMLLVLDNCEQVVQAAGEFVSALVERAPRVHVLSTSQEVLKLHDEHLYRLETLAVPRRPELSTAQTFGAVSLFVERIVALRPEFVLGADNVADVVAICRELDGLPLALELAAARVPLLGVSGVRERLGERFRMLTGGSRDAPRRHQALHEAMDWSHGLLDAAEQTVFRRAGVFVGGFTTAAAEKVLYDESLDEWAVLDALGTLVEKSLVVVDSGDPPRYRLLESARHYALEKLLASGDGPAVSERHARAYLAEAELTEPRLTSAARRAPLARLRVELNNYRAAMDWFLQQRNDAAPALRLASSLAWLAYFDGLFAEARNWIVAALALPDAHRHERERAAVLSGAARLAAYSGDAAKAASMAEESVALWRRAGGDTRGLAYALFHLGIACLASNQAERARPPLGEALAAFRQLDDPWGVALGASYFGVAYAIVPGTEREARELLLDGRSRFRALGDEWGASVSSHYLGSIALRTGDHALARTLTEEMLANARELGDKYRIARNLHQLSEVLVAEGRLPDAIPLLHESLSLNVQQGRMGDAALQLRLLASLAAQLGAPVAAVRLAAVAARHDGAEPTIPRDDPARHAELLDRLRASLGEHRYRDEFARGQALSTEEALAAALSLADLPAKGITGAA